MSTIHHDYQLARCLDIPEEFVLGLVKSNQNSTCAAAFNKKRYDIISYSNAIKALLHGV